jgi:hypothetical protein
MRTCRCGLYGGGEGDGAASISLLQRVVGCTEDVGQGVGARKACRVVWCCAADEDQRQVAVVVERYKR